MLSTFETLTPTRNLTQSTTILTLVDTGGTCRFVSACASARGSAFARNFRRDTLFFLSLLSFSCALALGVALAIPSLSRLLLFFAFWLRRVCHTNFSSATLAWALERFVGATVVCLVVVILLDSSFLRTTIARSEPLFLAHPFSRCSHVVVVATFQIRNVAHVGLPVRGILQLLRNRLRHGRRKE